VFVMVMRTYHPSSVTIFSASLNVIISPALQSAAIRLIYHRNVSGRLESQSALFYRKRPMRKVKNTGKFFLKL
jgi:hypothetical protein